ncbi:S-adenosylmethionine-dependent methyltransferase functionally coupled to the MukBEF chromosome partitioning mechanism [Vibrio variabilis]|uniref:S-adenosylmethionine-dependent methyltransferase functionally coupled to the MukBEF chromosome partitioning mechanism n=1 Tax=Vibrio variabilis TaxID=990271 RepID=A0ABQ0J9X8_9VIBR|nr:S-adenosylmethionine-dependent methyltransferase functionally coupled to the MukBEF chromosome partitioning mechanism [Vibrio variabilis]
MILKKTLKVLDAGGGLGQVSQRIAERGHHITLCDLSSEMLKLAKAEVEKNGLLSNIAGSTVQCKILQSIWNKRLT